MFSPALISPKTIGKTFLLALFNILFLAVITCADASAQNVNVTASAGTAAATYPTLTAAFSAVNAGTHQGTITIEIAASTTEGATPAVLNSSGAGSASYTSIVIRPSADGVTVAGATPTGRGLIELNGADNVTINGDNPNTGGTNRNLTIQNTASATITFTSVVRIALATSVVTSADNVSIRNLNLVGSATGRNVSGASSAAGAENTTYGVLATAGASTVSATNAPAPITSVATTVGSPATAANLLIDNNSVATVARAIAVQGSSTSVFPGLAITNNSIGNATPDAVDQVYSVGITAQGSANGSIAGNTVHVEGFVAASTNAANRAIDIGGINVSGAAFTIERNRVNRMKNNAPDYWLAHGINLNGGSNHVVRNNFVIGITHNATSGGFFNNTFAAVGIRVATGTGHQIYHNSVNLTGAIPGTTLALSAAFMITSATLTGVNVRNNIFANSLTGGSGASAHVSIYLPSGANSTMNLTLNNNDYFEGGGATNGIAQVGATVGTGFYKAADFNPDTTTPASNLRSYTSTLSTAGTNDNASKVVDPQFISATDLHIAPTSPMVDMGANVGVATDIDFQSRVPPPDIGADEPGGITVPTNDISATAIINPPTGATRAANTPFTVQASFTNNGTAAQTNVPVRFIITDTSNNTIVYNQTALIASINPNQTVVVTFSNATLPPGSYTTTAQSELAGDEIPGNNSIAGTLTVFNPLSGDYTVGTGGNFTSLTNPGGIFDAINGAGLTGHTVINITSDLTAETGLIALNQITGGFTLTIKPSGAPRTISGTSSTLGLIKLNGADNVVIDGSLSGGTDRSLTITNGNLNAAVIWIASASVSNGANYNTVKNCILSGNTGATIIAGVLSGSGATLGGDAETRNSNNTIQNNLIFRVQNGLFLRGNPVTLDQNWLVTGNTMGSNVAADKLTFRGMLIGNAQDFIVSYNTINGVVSPSNSSSTVSGIQVALAVNGGSINANKMSDIKQTNPDGWGSNGIFLSTSSTAARLTVSNNFISDVASQGFEGVEVTDNGYGIVVAAGGGYKIYHNSIWLNTSQVAAGSITAALNVIEDVTTVGAIDLRDNILANTETVGTRYAVYCSVPANVFSNSDYNDYFAQNVGFLGSPRPTLADWQAVTGQDANSLSVDPQFVSTTDLHLQPTSPLINAGTPVGITTDVDGQVRVAAPDIGADEPGGFVFVRRPISAFDGDARTDVAVWNPNNHNWYILDSSTNLVRVQNDWGSGALGDIAVPRDYDGDGRVDVAVFRPSEGNWYIIKSSDSTVLLINWGLPGDVPVPADYDADGRADIAIYRPTEGNWYIIQSTAGGIVKGWGLATDKPVPADYDGDGRADIAVWRPSEGNWYIIGSFASAGIVRNWGLATDVPVPADYDGDGITDLAVFRPSEGNWYIIRSSTGGAVLRGWGASGDIPVPGDYDGDGRADAAVFRPSEGNWYISRSSTGTMQVVYLGSPGDVPAPATYHPQ